MQYELPLPIKQLIKEGNKNSIEGTYIFNQNNEYHILYTEKGKVKEDRVTSEKEEVLWCIVEIISFDIAMEYAIKNKKEGRAFRRALFKKEIEIYSLFGEKFEKKKRPEIEEILKKVLVMIFNYVYTFGLYYMKNQVAGIKSRLRVNGFL